MCKPAWLWMAILAGVPLAAQKENPAYALPDSVELIPNIVYTSGDGPAKQLDLYLPKSGTGPYPAVVYIHGGGWNAGSKNAFRRQAAYMATKGFVGACINYRLSHRGEVSGGAARRQGGGALATRQRGQVPHQCG